MTPSATQQDRTIVATFSDSERSGKTCASKYEAEIRAYEDSREFRALDRFMRSNRACFLS